MIKLGVTGGIGSGKSIVCQVFLSLGIPVYNADIRAKYIVENNPQAINQIQHYFGSDIYQNQLLDKKKLAAIVFNNKEKLQILNSIVHPLVDLDFENWLYQNKENKIVVKEAAILFESGAFKKVDKILCVTAPIDLRISRIQKRDRVDVDEIIQRMRNQMDDQEKIKRSDFVLINDEQNLIIPQIKNILKELEQIG